MSTRRVVIAIVAAVAALNLLAVAVDALFPSPGGPRSSAFATQAEGLAAWASLARSEGIEVRALRRPPSARTLPDGGTVVILDPQELARPDALALRRFAEAGGRLVAGGTEPDWLGDVVRGLEWEREGEELARVLAAAPETGEAAAIRSAGQGRWRETGGARALVGGPLLAVAEAGAGRIALVADPSPLQNRLLGEADNAALALALAGEGPLVFVESVHGYGTGQGLAALPGRFRWGLALLGLAGLVLIAARWRRLGPPDPRDEPLFPPRRAYVDALAATLARSRDRAAAADAVRTAARERLARRAALPRDAEPVAWIEAARSAGLSHEEARALAGGTDVDGIAAGQALAKLSNVARRSTGGVSGDRRAKRGS